MSGTIGAGYTNITSSGTYALDVEGFALVNNSGFDVTFSSLRQFGTMELDVSNGGAYRLGAGIGLFSFDVFNLGTYSAGLNGPSTTPGSGTLEIGSGVSFFFSPLNLTGTHDTLILDSGVSSTVLDSTINGWAVGDTIAFGGQSVVTETYRPLTGVLNVTFAGGGTSHVTFALGQGLTPSSFGISSGNVVFACFARGTRIAVPGGERRIEALVEGDLVITASGRAVPIKWIGRRRIRPGSLPRPELVQPISIRRNAIAESVPHRDLVLSPDHALLVAGRLVPAYLLVNGGTVLQRRDVAEVEYFHLELDRHDIILAEGAPAESYIDTGNRSFFANCDGAVGLHPDFAVEADHPARVAGACMALTVDPRETLPVWQLIADRAEALGYRRRRPPTTREPVLRLSALERTLSPNFTAGDRYVFAIPRGTRSVQLHSRTVVPNDLSPWIEDRRRLGVAIRRIAVLQDGDRKEIAVDSPELAQGWWSCEGAPGRLFRWTDGSAELPMPPDIDERPALIEIYLGGKTEYPLDEEQPAIRQAA